MVKYKCSKCAKEISKVVWVEKKAEELEITYRHADVILRSYGSETICPACGETVKTPLNLVTFNSEKLREALVKRLKERFKQEKYRLLNKCSDLKLTFTEEDTVAVKTVNGEFSYVRGNIGYFTLKINSITRNAYFGVDFTRTYKKPEFMWKDCMNFTIKNIDNWIEVQAAWNRNREQRRIDWSEFWDY